VQCATTIKISLMKKSFKYLDAVTAPVWGLTVFFTLVGFASRFSWLADLACHFRVQYSIVLFFGIVFFAFLRRKRIAAALGVALVLNLAQIAPLYVLQAKDSLPGTDLTVMSMNINTENTDYARALNCIRKYSPDIVFVQETDMGWCSFLSTRLIDYRYQHFVPREDNFGMGVLSRLPLTDSATTFFETSVVPAITSKMHLSDRVINIVNVHTLPPVRPGNYKYRDKELFELGSYLRGQSGDLIVCGDFNTTSWSGAFQELIQRAGLKDSRQGLGVEASWPSNCFLLLIPLDHCLISKDIETIDRKVLEPIGSDHYPILIKLRVH
jgi:endonuclease/exonuclease/phosphatase (EEP) superfamily protein YafD